MDVRDAVDRRASIRAFLDTPVPDDLIADLLMRSARAPSGGNVQPWRIYVLNGDTMATFREFMDGRDLEPPGYDIYPPKLWEPYRTNRFALGEQMYALLGIPRERAARMEPRLQRLLGYGIYKGLIGHVDKRDPIELLGAADGSSIVWDRT